MNAQAWAFESHFIRKIGCLSLVFLVAPLNSMKANSCNKSCLDKTAMPKRCAVRASTILMSMDMTSPPTDNLKGVGSHSRRQITERRRDQNRAAQKNYRQFSFYRLSSRLHPMLQVVI